MHFLFFSFFLYIIIIFISLDKYLKVVYAFPNTGFLPILIAFVNLTKAMSKYQGDHTTSAALQTP